MKTGLIHIPKEHHGKAPKPAKWVEDAKGCWICISHTACINPDHLETGTIADNNKDRHARGRDARNFGTKNGNSSLTEDQVREILLNPEQPLIHFAQKFGVWKTTISEIRNRNTWQFIK